MILGTIRQTQIQVANTATTITQICTIIIIAALIALSSIIIIKNEKIRTELKIIIIIGIVLGAIATRKIVEAPVYFIINSLISGFENVNVTW